MSGFIALHREALDHHLFAKDSARLGAWFWLLGRAVWKPTKFNVSGKTIELQRGQYCCSVRDLAEAWGWTKSSVDRFLTRLRSETMIETSTGTGRLVITICNYSKYQDVRDDTGTASGTPSGTASGHERDIKEQGNKGTREPNGSPSSGASEQDENAPAKRGKAKRQAGVDRPLPDDWEPTLTPRAQEIVDRWPPGMFERELFKFRSHAVANGRLAKDWDAAFRTWIGNSDERLEQTGHRNRQAAGGSASGYRGPVDRRDSFTREIDRAARIDGSDVPPRSSGELDLGGPPGHRELRLTHVRPVR